MKKLLAGVALCSCLAVPALSADIPVKAPPPPPVVTLYNWSGCYLGVYGGYQSTRIKPTYGANGLAIAPGTQVSNRLEPNGLALGPTVGCNVQSNHWVFGVEGDVDFISKDDTQVETLFPTFRVKAEQNWLATVRGRVGYAAQRGFIFPVPTLYYLTGGVAWANYEVSNFIPGSAVFTVAQKETHVGWTVGFGSEYALGRGWSIKSETLYISLREKGYFSATDPVAVGVFDIKPRIWVSKIGLNYKFNWGGPVVARY